MIRRDFQLVGSEPQWLLISQIEHARISEVLAKHCANHFGQSATGSDLRQVREELLAAILHHDDGWAAWEAALRIDAQGRPPSFRELPLAESIPVWTASIDAAAQLGDLAGWIVAEHFLALLQSSEKSFEDAQGTTWRAEMNQQNAERLVRWQATDPQLHSKALANEALAWLQLFDVMSLWLCSVCPSHDEEVGTQPASYCAGEGMALETTFAHEASTKEERRCTATIEPWRFDAEELKLEAIGWVVPMREYRTVEELKSAMLPHELRWLLGKRAS